MSEVAKPCRSEMRINKHEDCTNSECVLNDDNFQVKFNEVVAR